MALRMIYLFVTGFNVYVTAVDDLQCRITTNLGNHSYNVFNLSDTLILTCSNVGGNRGISIKRWVRDDTDDKNTTSFIYTKSNITRNDAGKYECTLKTRNMTSKPCATFVNINVRPHVKMKSDTSSSHLSVKCFVDAYPMPEIFVYKDGEKLHVKNKTEEDRQHYELSIEETYPSKSENGNYTCSARNKYGTSSSTIPVTNIAEKCPYFLKPGLTNITIHIGETKSLICRVCRKSSTLDKPSFNGPRSNKFSRSNTKECTADGVHLRTLVLNHTIFNATKYDTGFYVCTYKRDHLISCNDLTKRFYLSVKEPLVSPRRKNVYVAVVVSICGAVIGIFLLFLVCYLRRKKPQRFYDSMPELRWDVFVSYSSKDFLWVKDLCESFEQPPFNLTVCLHQRDWELGRTVIDNMADSVYCSHKTLIVLSKHYVESAYCMQELQIAMHNELSSNTFDKERVVMIKIDGVSLKKLPKALRQKSYLDFSNNEQRKHLKTKLLRALPRKLEMIGETSGENEICGDDSNDCCVGVEDQQTELVVLTR